MKKLILTAAAIFFTFAAGVTAEAAITPKEPSGSGTWRSPYNISSAENLYWFAQYCASGNDTTNLYAQLTDDIVVNDKQVNANSTANDVEVWTPIMDYAGKFYGKNHTISGLYVRGSEYAGLFGTTKSTAYINELTIDNSFFEGTKYTGAVVAYNEGRNVVNCVNKAELRSYSDGAYTGGIVGYQAAETYLSGCLNYGDIYGTEYTGGIAGAMVPMDEGAYNLGNYGTICGGKYAGGIVGYMECTFANTELKHCFNLGNIYASEYAGGIAGYSYNYTGTSSAGGSAGMAWFILNYIGNSFNYGQISAAHTYPIAGHIEGGLRTEYCYYLKGAADEDFYTETVILPNGGGVQENKVELGIPLTADEFASGKVTYILNESGNDSYLWGQNIDNGKTPDLYPCSWYDGHDTVYYNVLEDKYSNTLNAYETAFRYNGDVTMDENIDMLDVVQVLKKAESSDYLMPIEAFFAEKNEQVDTVYGDMDGDNAVTDKDAEIMLHIIMLSK